jgi:hypothetical protein
MEALEFPTERLRGSAWARRWLAALQAERAYAGKTTVQHVRNIMFTLISMV